MSLFTLRGVWRISSRVPRYGAFCKDHWNSNTRSSVRKKLPNAGPSIATPCVLSLAWFAATSSQSEEKEKPRIESHFRDLEDIFELKRRTLICKICGKRKIIQAKVEGIEYCSCSSPYFQSSDINSDEALDWIPFLEQKDILVWRKAHPKLDGLYAYKMYGRFHDVSAKEFLAAQLDISDFRKSWDTSTVECKAMEETVGELNGSIDQIYYWEVAWPKFFANRDYVCQRKVRMDEESGRIVVYTEAITHPECPRYNKKFRVEDYFSILTIQSVEGSDLDAKGLEFTLTAYENPGLSLPTSITTWVAMRGLPQYILEMRRACLQKKSHSLGLLSTQNKNFERDDVSTKSSDSCVYS